MQAKQRIHAMLFSTVYPLYVRKVERKNSTREELDAVICWLTGYDAAGLQRQIDRESDFAALFAAAPALHPNAAEVRGVVCGVRVEDIEDPLVRNVRRLDKLVDELAKGKALVKIMR